MRVANPTARAFYEIEAARESWASRELERQIASLLFRAAGETRDREKVSRSLGADTRSRCRPTS
ncbi:MAG: hypothetical protein IPI49_28605 [Myxococcales bacterium]|nr:hypothetical protein [Myxococcales bacterium]